MTSLNVSVTYAIAGATIVAHIGLVVFILATLVSAHLKEWLHQRVGKHGVLLGLTLIGFSIIGSLFFSDVAGLAPCFLCWIERALLYPQIILFGWYIYKARRWMLDVALWMTIAGFIITAYHVFLENGAPALIPCPTGFSIASCSTKYFEVFGYVTIPVMSLTAFATLLIVLIVVLHRKHWLPAKALRQTNEQW
jgi:disulfide bond formation protein DsbB